ncbi:hypothetical protein UPYG_G00076950 [Umbra pygmaea]|uniref:P2X purinoreceptor 7 intracellular domain-containing protein n=1 Tax=Umbra pygmaea TaxID=75934 RepID=A0ABD0XXI0_UMBPY
MPEKSRKKWLANLRLRSGVIESKMPVCAEIISSRRFYDESFAGSEYTHEPCTSSRQGQARNPATRARGRRGRSVGATNLGEEDLRRVLSLQAQTAAYEQDKICEMSLDQSHQVLELCLTRDPSLMFDVLQRLSENAPPTGPPVSGQLTWCVCQRCREMPTFVEKKCCGQHPEYCVSMLRRYVTVTLIH